MKSLFHYDGDVLCCEDTPVRDIAEGAGTPCYVYSSRAIVDAYRAYDDALGDVPHRVCYAVKANSTAAILARA